MTKCIGIAKYDIQKLNKVSRSTKNSLESKGKDGKLIHNINPPISNFHIDE